MEEQTKRCNKCGEIKKLNDFYKDSRNTNGFQYSCKLCRKSYLGSRRFEFTGDIFSYTKKCVRCKRIKIAFEFNKSRNNKDGLSNCCKVCLSEYHSKHYIKNKDKLLIYQKEYYENNRDRVLARNGAYNENHRVEKRAYDYTYYIQNKERIKNRVCVWRKENPKRYRIQQNHRKSIKLNLLHDLTIGEWEYLLSYYDYCCAYCGRAEEELSSKLTQEHVFPMSRGGGYTASNIVPACVNCNSHKGNRLLEETDMNLIKPQPITQLILWKLTRKE